MPHLDAGPYLSYGIKWVLFGVLAPIALGYFVYSEVRARRRDKQGLAVAEPKPTAMTVEDKLADRYGRRR